MDLKAMAVKLFEFFYSKVYKTNYKLDAEKSRKLISNFIELLYKQYNPQAVGVNLMIDYYIYAFEYWASKQTKRRITLNWIIGKKLFSKWVEKKDSWKFYCDNFIRENNINIDDLRHKLTQDFDKEENDCLKTHPSEESIKASVMDTEARLFNCINSTTLYNHRSLVCVTCNQKIACKNILKKTNIELYLKRGYGAKDGQ